MSDTFSALAVGWTTVSTAEDAEALARTLVEARLAACAQIDGPLTSIYHWDGALQRETEYRVTLKFVADRETALRQALVGAHPYATPQWITVRADRVHPPYANWVRDNTRP